jgi:hypothetical protein
LGVPSATVRQPFSPQQIVVVLDEFLAVKLLQSREPSCELDLKGNARKLLLVLAVPNKTILGKNDPRPLDGLTFHAILGPLS